MASASTASTKSSAYAHNFVCVCTGIAKGGPVGAGRAQGNSVGGGMHQSVRVPLRTRAAAYVALTKPRIIELLLVTTVPTMVVADRGLPHIGLIVATVLGGTMAAGGANAINM